MAFSQLISAVEKFTKRLRETWDLHYKDLRISTHAPKLVGFFATNMMFRSSATYIIDHRRISLRTRRCLQVNFLYSVGSNLVSIINYPSSSATLHVGTSSYGRPDVLIRRYARLLEISETVRVDAQKRIEKLFVRPASSSKGACSLTIIVGNFPWTWSKFYQMVGRTVF
jgi:hypothetical protein